MSEIDLLIEELEDIENNPIKPFVAIRIVWYLCKYKYHEYRIADLEAENTALKQHPQPIEFLSDEKKELYRRNESRTIKSGREEEREE